MSVLSGLYQRQRSLGLDIPEIVATDSPKAARLFAFAGVRYVVVGPDNDEHKLAVLDDIVLRTRFGYSMVISVDSFEEAVLAAVKIAVDFGLETLELAQLGDLDWDEAAEEVTKILKGNSKEVNLSLRVKAADKYMQVLKQFADVEVVEGSDFDELFALLGADIPQSSVPFIVKHSDYYEILDEDLTKSVLVLFEPTFVFEVGMSKEILARLEGGEE